MAQSRIIRHRSIFDRMTGLLERGAVKIRPIWYDVYKAFPPKYDPYFSRPAPDISVKPIFYEEDRIRAQIHDGLSKSKYSQVRFSVYGTNKHGTQHLIDNCSKLMKSGLAMDEAIAKVLNDGNAGV
ncbi:UNVERIFIED_CONTAM: hypothetical protein PYX00_005188 [Menopon gallinae]|uniref:Small ribosomal subunit protein mS23 n=1 Tax=Menopon gallinae TaxID=328185 RepID=A0AAW2HQD8_9NEOP